MRSYKTFKIMMNETKRELKEMGIIVKSLTYQDKESDAAHSEVYELPSYSYIVYEPNSEEVPGTSQPWAVEEFEERLLPDINPGTAYLKREEIWKSFLNDWDKFDYTYSERLHPYLEIVIKLLKDNPSTRQAFLPVFDSYDLFHIGGEKRIPCSIGYHFIIRENKLHMTYLQRSADFVTHFANDVYLACKLGEYVAEQIEMGLATFTHWIGSLHVFTGDVADVF
jgi:thymidylate synthase